MGYSMVSAYYSLFIFVVISFYWLTFYQETFTNVKTILHLPGRQTGHFAHRLEFFKLCRYAFFKKINTGITSSKLFPIPLIFRNRGVTAKTDSKGKDILNQGTIASTCFSLVPNIYSSRNLACGRRVITFTLFPRVCSLTIL